MGFCNCSMFCCALLYVNSSFAIILMGKRELVDYFVSWCLVIVVRLFLTMPIICLQFVIVVFPDHTNYFSYQGLPVGFLLLRYSVILTDESLSLLYLLFIS